MLKKIGKGLIFALLALIIAVAAYAAYVMLQYYRIDDHLSVATQNNQAAIVKTGGSYKIAASNIGFGAYSPEYSFFMDTGETLDGKKLSGKYGKALSKEVVIRNTNSAMTAIDKLNADFLMIQETDTDSTRSYHVNQLTMLGDYFSQFSTTFASNYHSAYFAIPIFDNTGASNAGLTTLSQCNVTSSVRRSLPLDNSFMGKFTDLDRCILVSRVKTDTDKDLVLINVHLSAYQSADLIRQQIDLLNEILEAERGNYVIIGGDFNIDLTNSTTTFKTGLKVPPWVETLDKSLIADGYSIVTAKNNQSVPTSRNANAPYEKDVSYTLVIDGFIVSDNIKATSENIDTGFAFSDHNPVLMDFTLM